MRASRVAHKHARKATALAKSSAESQSTTSVIALHGKASTPERISEQLKPISEPGLAELVCVPGVESDPSSDGTLRWSERKLRPGVELPPGLDHTAARNLADTWMYDEDSLERYALFFLFDRLLLPCIYKLQSSTHVLMYCPVPPFPVCQGFPSLCQSNAYVIACVQEYNPGCDCSERTATVAPWRTCWSGRAQPGC